MLNSLVRENGGQDKSHRESRLQCRWHKNFIHDEACEVFRPGTGEFTGYLKKGKQDKSHRQTTKVTEGNSNRIHDILYRPRNGFNGLCFCPFRDKAYYSWRRWSLMNSDRMACCLPLITPFFRRKRTSKSFITGALGFLLKTDSLLYYNHPHFHHLHRAKPHIVVTTDCNN